MKHLVDLISRIFKFHTTLKIGNFLAHVRTNFLVNAGIQDCKYFLGCGSRFSKYLWGCCVENHIQAMRILWDSFSDDEKPEWTSLEEIERFSKKMLEEEIY